jgi:hypothetical protein
LLPAQQSQPVHPKRQHLPPTHRQSLYRRRLAAAADPLPRRYSSFSPPLLAVGRFPPLGPRRTRGNEFSHPHLGLLVPSSMESPWAMVRLRVMATDEFTKAVDAAHDSRLAHHSAQAVEGAPSRSRGP